MWQNHCIYVLKSGNLWCDHLVLISLIDVWFCSALNGVWFNLNAFRPQEQGVYMLVLLVRAPGLNPLNPSCQINLGYLIWWGGREAWGNWGDWGFRLSYIHLRGKTWHHHKAPEREGLPWYDTKVNIFPYQTTNFLNSRGTAETFTHTLKGLKWRQFEIYIIHQIVLKSECWLIHNHAISTISVHLIYDVSLSDKCLFHQTSNTT